MCFISLLYWLSLSLSPSILPFSLPPVALFLSFLSSYPSPTFSLFPLVLKGSVESPLFSCTPERTHSLSTVLWTFSRLLTGKLEWLMADLTHRCPRRWWRGNKERKLLKGIEMQPHRESCFRVLRRAQRGEETRRGELLREERRNETTPCHTAGSLLSGW